MFVDWFLTGSLHKAKWQPYNKCTVKGQGKDLGFKAKAKNVGPKVKAEA